MTMELSQETRERTVAEVREFLADEHELELGDLGATLLVERIVELVGPAIYNRAVYDVQTWLQAKLGDLDSDLFRAEPPPRK